jgi:hypothetical protein
MQFSWFGWLTKGHYQVTALDHMIEIAEIMVIFVVLVSLLYAYVWICKTLRRLRRVKQ